MKKITIVAFILFAFLQVSFSQAGSPRPETIISALVDKMIFMEPEKMPQYPGGLPELEKFINSKVQYPADAVKEGIQGTVYVGFVVDREGKVKDVRVLKGIGNGCDEEVVKVISQMPKWQPGMENGENVSVTYSLPVDFKIVHKDASPK